MSSLCMRLKPDLKNFKDAYSKLNVEFEDADGNREIMKKYTGN